MLTLIRNQMATITYQEVILVILTQPMETKGTVQAIKSTQEDMIRAISKSIVAKKEISQPLKSFWSRSKKQESVKWTKEKNMKGIIGKSHRVIKTKKE